MKFLKSLYCFIMATTLVILVSLSIAAVALFGIYQVYMKPKPVDFEFSQSAENITNVEIVKVTDIKARKPQYTTIATVSDVENFLKDFESLKCEKGLPVRLITDFNKVDSLTGIKITYSDESIEVITSYGNITSDLFTSDLKPDDLFTQKFYLFTESEFAALIKKYNTK